MSISFSTPSKLLSELGSLNPGMGEQVVPLADSLQADSPQAALHAETSQQFTNSANPIEVLDSGALLLLKDIDPSFGPYDSQGIPDELLAISDQTQASSADVADQWVNYILAAWH